MTGNRGGATGGVEYIGRRRLPKLSEKQARVLALIRHREGVTIHLLSAWTGATLTQCTAAVVVLLERNLVHVDGERVIRPGRPPADRRS